MVLGDTTARFELLKAKQEAEAERLKGLAEKSAAHALADTTISAGAALVARVSKDDGRGTLLEPAEDLKAIRNDHGLNGAIVRDIRVAQSQARMLIAGALFLGYRSQVEGTPLNGAKLKVVQDSQLRQELDGYPILGETADEHAKAIAEVLRRDVHRTLGMPLTGQADPTKVAAALGLVAEQHAARVASAVAEAYFAGTQAGFIDAGKKLTGR